MQYYHLHHPHPQPVGSGRIPKLPGMWWVFSNDLTFCRLAIAHKHTHTVPDSASITPKPNHPQHIMIELLSWQRRPNVQPVFPSCSANDFMLPLRPWPSVGSTWPTRVPGCCRSKKSTHTGQQVDFMVKHVSLGDHLRFRGCNKNDLNLAKWDTLV